MPDPTLRQLKLDIKSDPKLLSGIRQKVAEFIENLGFDEECATQVTLALDEALTNVIRHAYDCATDKPVEITLAESAGELVIKVRDFGKNADPATFRSKDIRKLEPGGLGIIIMKKCMDEIVYCPAEGGGTILTMKKRLDAASADPPVRSLL